MINDLKKSGECKIHLIMKMKFMLSKYSNEKCLIHFKSDNEEITTGSDTEELIDELFDSLLHQINSEQSLKVSEFAFDYVDRLFYKYHNISLNRDGPYIGSSQWLKNQKTTTNPKNSNDNMCFKYAVAVALNHEETGKNPKRKSRIRPF